MAARAALILSGAGCVLPSVSSGIAVLAGTLRLKYICPRGSIAAFAFGSRLSSRFYRRVCLRFTPALAVLSPRLPLVHACLFSFVRKKETACGVLRFYSAGRDRLRAFSQCRCGYLPLWVHFGFVRFFMAISTGYRGAEDGDTGSAARPLCVFAQAHWPWSLSAGSTLGLRAPDCAKESMWKRHCRLSGLSSRCGGVMLVRIRAAVTRVHVKTRRTPIYGSAGRAV